MYIKKIDFERNTNKDFSLIIDVRTSEEFNEDHIPGSKNFQILNNAQREEVGKIYIKDRFKARNIGAQYVTLNISQILKKINLSKKDKILIYCWRGGLRSQSLYIVLKNIGYDVTILEKGYKSYRKYINRFFSDDIHSFDFNVLSGLTGTGKTFFLKKLSKHFNVLDIETLAKHKGSILGDLPKIKQPKQKKFESNLWGTISKFDIGQRIWVESESHRIGKLFIPNNLFNKMKNGNVFTIQMPIENRVNFILNDYDYLTTNEKVILEALKVFKKFVTKKEFEKLEYFYSEKKFKSFVRGLLENHYDLVYSKRNIYNKNKKIIDLKSVDSGSFQKLLRLIGHDKVE